MANVTQEASRSVWASSVPAIRAPALDRDVQCDVVVVGSGIAGMSCAYELERLGKTVVVIDRGPIGGGMTARTTAHLVTQLDDYYHELIRARGQHDAHLCYESQVTAINRIEAICLQEAIGADLARIDGYLFAAEPGHQSDLERIRRTDRPGERRRRGKPRSQRRRRPRNGGELGRGRRAQQLGYDGSRVQRDDRQHARG